MSAGLSDHDGRRGPGPGAGGAADAPLDEAVAAALRAVARTVSLDALRAGGRTTFRTARLDDVRRETSEAAGRVLASRLRETEEQCARVVEQRERDALAEGRLSVLSSLVDLADLVDRVRGAVEGTGAAVAVKALDRRIDRVFAENGFARIVTAGAAYDAARHEAVDTEPAGTPGGIVREVARGYVRDDGYVLRAARVVVPEGSA